MQDNAFYYTSSTFVFKGFQPLSAPYIKHENLQLLNVKEGYWGIMFRNGQIEAVDAGAVKEYWSPYDVFAGFVARGKATLKLSEVRTVTADNVSLLFDSAITVEICDPKKAISDLQPSDVEGTNERLTVNIRTVYNQIKEQAHSHLCKIIGLNNFSNAHSSTTVTNATQEPQDGAAPPPLNPEVAPQGTSTFKTIVQDAIMEDFKAQMLESGVVIRQFSIENLDIADVELRSRMGKLALIEQEKKEKQAEGIMKNTIATAEARNVMIKTQAEYDSRLKLADAEAQEILKVNNALSQSGEFAEMWKMRKLAEASADTLKNAKATIVLGSNMGDVSTMLAGSSVINAANGH